MTTLQEQARALGDPTRHGIFRYVADADRPVGSREAPGAERAGDAIVRLLRRSMLRIVGADTASALHSVADVVSPLTQTSYL